MKRALRAALISRLSQRLVAISWFSQLTNVPGSRNVSGPMVFISHDKNKRRQKKSRNISTIFQAPGHDFVTWNAKIIDAIPKLSYYLLGILMQL